MLGLEMLPCQADGAFNSILALIDLHGMVQQVCNKLGDLAAAVLKDFAFCLNVLHQGGFGALGSGFVRCGHGRYHWLCGCMDVDIYECVDVLVRKWPRLTGFREVMVIRRLDHCVKI
jgi:hypothetical protein